MSIRGSESGGNPGAIDGSGGDGRPRSVAGEYRRRRANRRAPWIWTALEVAAFAIVVGIVYLATTPAPIATATPPAINEGTAPSDEVDLDLAGPAIGNVSCGTAQLYSTERLTVENLTATLYTNEVDLFLVELGDNDVISSVSTTPGIASNSACTGPAPGGTLGWYAVLISGAGLVLGSYTYSEGWLPVAGAQYPAPIYNGSSLEVVLAQPIAGYGYGLEIGGVEGGPSIQGGAIL